MKMVSLNLRVIFSINIYAGLNGSKLKENILPDKKGPFHNSVKSYMKGSKAIDLIFIILGLIVVIIASIICFSAIFAVVSILTILGLISLGVFAFYQSAASGEIIDCLWILSAILSLIVLIPILLGRLTFIPFRIHRAKKTSFKLRLLNIIILFVVLSLITTFSIHQVQLFDDNESPSLII